MQLLLAVISLVCASALIAEHEVKSLPGWKEGDLPSRMWSGYIPIASGDRTIHYWFIESQNEPTRDPVLLWTQGGPGASGMLGLLTEMGPFETNDASFDGVKEGEVPRVFRRENPWTKFANMLFFEAPAGVGYSNCRGGNDQCPLYNDSSVAVDNYEFLQRWFTAFPEFQDNEFYITGESYAGVYVPMMADLVLANPAAIKNFQGVVVGDGCLGIRGPNGKGPTDVLPSDSCGVDDQHWFTEFMHGHGQFSTATYKKLKKECGDALRSIEWRTMPKCMAVMEQVKAEMGGYFVYNIFDECDGMGDLKMAPATRRRLAKVQGALNDYSCGSTRAMYAWITHPLVKEALHVEGSWEEHDGWPGHYVSTERDVRPIYQRLVEGGKRVLIFYGDVDGGVPYNGGEYWTSHFGLKEVEPWRPWTVDGKRRMAGYVTRYEKNFDYVTVRGAGHMVPTYKPVAALVMIGHWLDRKPLPPFDVNAPTQPPIMMVESPESRETPSTIVLDMAASYVSKAKVQTKRVKSLEAEVAQLRGEKETLSKQLSAMTGGKKAKEEAFLEPKVVQAKDNTIII